MCTGQKKESKEGRFQPSASTFFDHGISNLHSSSKPMLPAGSSPGVLPSIPFFHPSPNCNAIAIFSHICHTPLGVEGFPQVTRLPSSDQRALEDAEICVSLDVRL